MDRHKYIKGEKSPDPDEKRSEVVHGDLEKMAKKLDKIIDEWGSKYGRGSLRDEIRRERQELEEARGHIMEEIRRRRAILEERNGKA